MIKAVIRYSVDGVYVKNTFYRMPNDHSGIYDLMMELTGNDHEISADAASWCELATVGEIYEFREGEIEIMEVDQSIKTIF